MLGGRPDSAVLDGGPTAECRDRNLPGGPFTVIERLSWTLVRSTGSLLTSRPSWDVEVSLLDSR
jgi:hypothetical protein